MSSVSRRDDSRSRSRRDSPPSRSRRDSSPDSSRRRESSRSHRSPEPPRKERADDELPESFGRGQEEKKDDDGSVLFRMKSGYKGSPLSSIAKCVDGSRKIKVWTRNFKEVRGICTGYVIAFDKHWNLMMSDVDEVYLKPRKAKTPYLSDANERDVPEIGPKVPRKKKDPAAPAAEKEATESASEEPASASASEDTPKPAEGGKKKRKRKKKKGSKSDTRNIRQVFIRGDNVVMVAILGDDE